MTDIPDINNLITMMGGMGFPINMIGDHALTGEHLMLHDRDTTIDLIVDLSVGVNALKMLPLE